MLDEASGSAPLYRQIYEAIRVQDADAARRRTLRHLSAYSQKLASAVLSEARSGDLKR